MSGDRRRRRAEGSRRPDARLARPRVERPRGGPPVRRDRGHVHRRRGRCRVRGRASQALGRPCRRASTRSCRTTTRGLALAAGVLATIQAGIGSRRRDSDVVADRHHPDRHARGSQIPPRCGAGRRGATRPGGWPRPTDDPGCRGGCRRRPRRWSSPRTTTSARWRSSSGRGRSASGAPASTRDCERPAPRPWPLEPMRSWSCRSTFPEVTPDAVGEHRSRCWRTRRGRSSPSSPTDTAGGRTPCCWHPRTSSTSGSVATAAMRTSRRPRPEGCAVIQLAGPLQLDLDTPDDLMLAQRLHPEPTRG